MSDLPWDLEYFKPTPVSDVLGNRYLVESSAINVAPGGTVVITAQLANTFGDPVAQAGHVITWAKTGAGGGFATPTSETDENGAATVVLTVSSSYARRHVVTATDQYGMTGDTGTDAVEKIEAANDALRDVRDQFDGATEFLADSILGMTGAGGFLTSALDLSGMGRVITLGTNAPRFTPTLWDATHPAMRVVKAETRWIKVAMGLVIPQPCSIVVVMNNYVGADGTTGNENLVNPGACIVYRAAGFLDRWSQYAGNPVNSNIISSVHQGKRIRMDVFNGAASECWSGTVDGGAMNPGAGSISSADMGIGARNDGVDPATADIAAVLVVSRALTLADRTFLRAFYQTRFPGVQ